MAQPNGKSDDIELTISAPLNTSAIKVHCNKPGMLQNELFCYGLLEMAKKAIYDFNRQQKEDRRIEVPELVIKPD